MIKSRLKKVIILISLAITSLGLLGAGVIGTGPLTREKPHEKAYDRVSMQTKLDILSKKAIPAFSKVENYSTYPYPYYSLAKDLQELGQTEIPIFSYGSLMDQKSAADTLSPKSIAASRPVIAFGAKRLFNRDVGIKTDSHWGQPNHASARGMLNLRLTGSTKDMVNGVVVPTRLSEIPKLLDREEGYDLVPILYTYWEDFEEGKQPVFGVAYTFRAKTMSKYTSSKVLPRPNYYELTRNSAKGYGESFYQLWLESTYLSDGVTKVHEWERAVQNEEPKTQASYL